MERTRKDIHDVNITHLDDENPIVGYADGDVVIIDNVKDLSNMNPVRPDMNFIIFCYNGRLQVDKNGETVILEKNDVLFSPPNVILDNYMFSPDFECKIVCLSNKIIQTLLHGNMLIWNRAVYVNKRSVLRMPDADTEQIDSYYGLIRSKMHNNGRIFQKEIMQSVTRAMLLELCSILDSSDGQQIDTKMSLGRQLFDRFLILLSNNKIKRQSVGHYAFDLSVTPKYLTMMCKKYSNMSASDWIERYVKDEIHYYLKDTDLTVKEISVTLNFPTVSFFGSYVKKHFGMSPRAYRLFLNQQYGS